MISWTISTGIVSMGVFMVVGTNPPSIQEIIIKRGYSIARVDRAAEILSLGA
jgi:hypothetical protein